MSNLKHVVRAFALLVALFICIKFGLAPVKAADSEPQVSVFTTVNGGMRTSVYCPDEKALFTFKEDGTCINSWRLGAPGKVTETKCK